MLPGGYGRNAAAITITAVSNIGGKAVAKEWSGGVVQHVGDGILVMAISITCGGCIVLRHAHRRPGTNVRQARLTFIT